MLFLILLLTVLFCLIGYAPYRHRQCALLRVSHSDVRDAIAHNFPGEMYEDMLMQSEISSWEWTLCILITAPLATLSSAAVLSGLHVHGNISVYFSCIVVICILLFSSRALSKSFVTRIAITESYVIWGDVRQTAPWNCIRRSDVIYTSWIPRGSSLTIKTKGTRLRFCAVFNCGEIAEALYINPIVKKWLR